MSPLVIGIGALLLGVQLLVVWPLLRRPRADAGDGDEARAVRLYRQQLAEIERGCADGLIDAGEAEALKAEVKRRMLAVAAAGQSPKPQAPPPPTGRRLSAAVLACLVAAASVALYAQLGAPRFADQPLAARREQAGQALAGAVTPEQRQSLEGALAVLTRRLKAAPGDVESWRLLARAHWTLGQVPEALAALRRAHAASGNEAETAAELAEALVIANGGRVGTEAGRLFASIPPGDAAHPHARYYLGLRKAQEGDVAGAAADWAGLIADAPADAPWLPQVRAQLARAEAALARGKGLSRDAPAEGPPAASEPAPPGQR